MKLTILFLLAFAAGAQTKSPAPVPATESAATPLDREAQLEIKNIAFEEKEAAAALQKVADLVNAPIQVHKQDLIQRVCGKAKIDVKECVIDAEKNTVSRKPAEPPKPGK